MFPHNQQAETITHILKMIEELHHLHDVDTILDRILLEARQLARADAGSIYLIDGRNLIFSHVQNNSLFNINKASTALYKNFEVPINNNSLVGFSALSGQHLVVADAYNLPADVPYQFNGEYDRKSGYISKSIFTIPLITFENRMVGVMQLINALDEHGAPSSFSEHSMMYVPLFANHAAVAIERGVLNRQLMLRMMKMAELRDPSETASHVQRVGAYSAEIYHRWAVNKNIPVKDIKIAKDRIRLAAMLHDVGKVGIPDYILKKPGKLTDAEFKQMRQHTLLGARLFDNTTSELDLLSRDIAHHHHQKWDGSGYPKTTLGKDNSPARQLQGKEIPLAARITALADVYDALSSARTYKSAWPREKIYDCLREGSNYHFDPTIVDAFFQITDLIEAIGHKYSDATYAAEERMINIKVNPDTYFKKTLACGNTEDILTEICHIFTLLDAQHDLSFIQQSYADIISLFHGDFPAFKASNTKFHDLKHTMSVVLATARLIHGVSLKDEPFPADIIEQGIIASLFHDTGFLQKQDDNSGTGAKYLQNHEERSIALLDDYLHERGKEKQYRKNCGQMIRCTILQLPPDEIHFSNRKVKRMGHILGTADILAQMSDRLYLERLPLLFKEFQEGGVPGYQYELDIFQKTEEFYQVCIKERLFKQFDNIAGNMRSHFKKRWAIDSDLYLETITRHINHIAFMNAKCSENIKCYFKYLRRQDG